MARSTDTSRRLREEALRLFEERGFDKVTVEEIARAAGVSHMTFFRHFPTKESVVFDDPYDPMIEEAVTRQGKDLQALERVRRGILEAWGTVEEPGDGATRARLRLASDHPGLRARIWQNNHATEEVIVRALRDSGVRVLEARVAAGAVLGALTAALFDWADEPRGDTLGDRIRRALAPLECHGTETSS